MSTVRELVSYEAIEKMKELANEINICLFTTQLSSVPLQTRPMATQRVDDEGNLWFFSDRLSDKNLEVEIDNAVQLFYAHPGKAAYMSVYGHAWIVNDRQLIADMWDPMVKAWFKGGKDDPNIVLVKVIPEDAYYWDTKNNRLVSLIKIGVSKVTGQSADDGIEGHLKP